MSSEFACRKMKMSTAARSLYLFKLLQYDDDKQTITIRFKFCFGSRFKYGYFQFAKSLFGTIRNVASSLQWRHFSSSSFSSLSVASEIEAKSNNGGFLLLGAWIHGNRRSRVRAKQDEQRSDQYFLCFQFLQKLPSHFLAYDG